MSLCRALGISSKEVSRSVRETWTGNGKEVLSFSAGEGVVLTDNIKIDIY